MQSVLDNLCRCFGSDPSNMASNLAVTSTMEHSDSILESEVGGRGDVDTTRQGSNSRGSLPPTPDFTRGKRTKSLLSLQDKQWDNLFVSPSPGKKHNRRRTQDNDILDGFSMEQAQAVARAKLEAAQPGLKRKRRRGGKEDIFRSKNKPFSRSDSRNSLNPVHRFLSNHPAIMNSLCFASPINDSRSHEPAEVPLHKDSMQSEAISMHTADDTVTSTVYYETTKLAGLQQKNPPMPLFDSFQVEDKDGEEIHRIIATHSHSSQRLREMFRQQNWQVDLSDDDDDEDENSEDQAMEEDDIPPPMIHSSSESSRSSNGQRVL